MKGVGDIVVYTAVFDHYDVLVNPPSIGVDFVCFTDSKTDVPNGWEVKPIDIGGLSPKLASGKVKVFPHDFFQDYEYSLWIDGNVVLRSHPKELVSKYLKSSNLAIPEQPFRDCIYDEAEAVVKWGKSDPRITQEQMERYRSIGFPENFGLSETRVMLRRHNEEDVIDTMKVWWDEYSRGAERDQLSFEFAAWRTDLEYTQMPSDITVNSEFFKLYPHRNKIKGDAIYERCLRERWNPQSLATYSVAYLLLKMQVGTYNLQRAVAILREEGIGKVINMFYRHYT